VTPESLASAEEPGHGPGHQGAAPKDAPQRGQVPDRGREPRRPDGHGRMPGIPERRGEHPVVDPLRLALPDLVGDLEEQVRPSAHRTSEGRPEVQSRSGSGPCPGAFDTGQRSASAGCRMDSAEHEDRDLRVASRTLLVSLPISRAWTPRPFRGERFHQDQVAAPSFPPPGRCGRRRDRPAWSRTWRRSPLGPGSLPSSPDRPRGRSVLAARILVDPAPLCRG
jgi:hypothetical protein